MSDRFAHFRAQEHRYRAGAVMLLERREGDAKILAAPLRLALAWRSVEVSWEVPESDCPESERAVWEWLWSNVTVDYLRLAQASGQTVEDVEHWIPQLIASRLLYPDGSIASIVDQIAEGVINGAVRPKGI